MSLVWHQNLTILKHDLIASLVSWCFLNLTVNAWKWRVIVFWVIIQISFIECVSFVWSNLIDLLTHIWILSWTIIIRGSLAVDGRAAGITAASGADGLTLTGAHHLWSTWASHTGIWITGYTFFITCKNRCVYIIHLWFEWNLMKNFLPSISNI